MLASSKPEAIPGFNSGKYNSSVKQPSAVFDFSFCPVGVYPIYEFYHFFSYLNSHSALRFSHGSSSGHAVLSYELLLVPTGAGELRRYRTSTNIMCGTVRAARPMNMTRTSATSAVVCAIPIQIIKAPRAQLSAVNTAICL